MMTAHGLPAAAVPVLLAGAVVVELAGGLALLLGVQTRRAALVLFLYLIPVTLTMHNFWADQGMEQQNQMFHFLKNLAILGGLLEFCARGTGAVSLDALLGHGDRTSLSVWPRLRHPMH